jgi:hypothetical protein
VNALGDRAVGDARLAKVKTFVAVDRGIEVADHRHEDVGLREDFLNGRRRMGIGGRGIVAAEGFDLGTDDALRGGQIVARAGRGSEAEQNDCQHGEGAHEGAPG